MTDVIYRRMPRIRNDGAATLRESLTIATRAGSALLLDLSSDGYGATEPAKRLSRILAALEAATKDARTLPLLLAELQLPAAITQTTVEPALATASMP